MSEQAESAVGMPSRAGWQVPWTLIVFLMALSLPWIGSRYDTILGTQIAIYSLFAAEPEPAARHNRAGVVRACRLFRHRLLCLRHPDEDRGGAVLARLSSGRVDRGIVCRRLRIFLRAADQDLLRHADLGIFPDRLGRLLQVERSDRRRSGPARRAVPRSRLDGRAPPLRPHAD